MRPLSVWWRCSVRVMVTDRGWAWVVLMAAGASHFLNGILAYLVGVMHAGILRMFQSSVTTAAWVGALYISLMALGAPVASVTISRFGCRVCCVLGGLLCFIGFTASAFVTSIEQLFVTYGLLAGLGLAFTYSPASITIGFYFSKYLGLASGIAGGCGAVGILSGSLIMQTLMDEFSLSGAFLLLGATSLHHSLFAMFYRPTPYEGRGAACTRTVEACDDQGEKYASRFSLAPHGLEMRTASLCSVSNVDVDKTPGKDRGQGTPLLENREPGRQLRLSTPSLVAWQEQCVNSVSRPVEELLNRYIEIHMESGGSSPSLQGKFASENSRSGIGLRVSDLHGHHLENGRTECIVSNSTHPTMNDSNLDNGCCHRPQLLPTQDELTAGVARVHPAREEVVRSDADEDDLGGACKRGKSAPRRGVWRAVGVYCDLLAHKAFMLHCSGFMAANIHISGVQLHLPEYAMRHGTTPTQAAALFVAVGILCFVSRLCSGVAVTEPQIHALTISMGMMGLCGLVTALFPLYSETYGGQMAFSALFGLYSGGLYSMVSVLTVRFVDVSRLSAAYGIKMFFMGVGVVSGPPLAALIVDSGGTYEHSFVFLGCMMMLGAMLDLTASFFLTPRASDVTREVVSSDTQHSDTNDVIAEQAARTEPDTVSS